MNKPDTPYHHGNLRKTLLDAAEEMLAQDGVNHLSLRAVARAAGVSHAAPYRHFKDKATLLRGIAQRGFEALDQAMKEIIEKDEDPRERLIEAGVAYVRLALENPDRTRLMFGGILEETADDLDFVKASADAFQGLAAVIRAGIEQGIFKGSPQILALCAWSTVHGFATLVLADTLLSGETKKVRLATAREVSSRIVQGFVAQSRT